MGQKHGKKRTNDDKKNSSRAGYPTRPPRRRPVGVKREYKPRSARYKLDDAETIRLIRLARRGDQPAFEKLLAAHRWLIESMAKKLVRQYPLIDIDDAEQASRIGFWHAIHDFNQNRGAILSSHATWRIRSQQNRLVFNIRHAGNEMLTDNAQKIADEIATRVLRTPRKRRGGQAEMNPVMRKRYRIILGVIARLGPAQLAALREKFDLFLPGPDIKLSSCMPRSEKYVAQAMKILRKAAKEMIQSDDSPEDGG